MASNRVIIEIPMNELTQQDEYFKRHTGIDLVDIPEKYGNSVLNAQKNIEDLLKIRAVYQYTDIAEYTESSVILSTGEVLSGKIPPLLLKDSSQVICLIVSLLGYEELLNKTTDIMENCFLDPWGTTYIEVAAEWIKNKLRHDLAAENLKTTHLWSPGQHGFDLINQRALFQVLKPEEIGCTLAKSCKIIPLKSISGIIGVIGENVISTILPCDFCTLKETCPASKSGNCQGI